MEKAKFLNKLDKATDKAAKMAIEQGLPIPGKEGVYIGNTIVEKNKSNLYNVVSLDHRVLYENISIFDIAVIIAQRYNSSEFGIIEKVLKIENEFTKYHLDMIHYLNCHKSAKKKKDYDKMYILEDKFRIAEQHAKKLKNNLAIFKKVK
jgi:hypothetical protein